MGIYTDAVQKLYVAYFNRPADAAGLTYWEGVVAAQKGSTAAVSAAFAASAEYKAAYAGMDAYNVVATVYQNLFGHAPDLPGLTFWGQGLLNKTFTVDTAVTEIAKGAQGSDLVAYNNKVAAATAFTVALDTPAEVLGYTGDAANQLAKNWMKGITDTPSLTAALASLDATVISVTNPPVVGQTYNLSQGLDIIAGTNGNDTFNAYAFNTTSGTAVDTMQSADSLDGGAGNDVLNIQVTAANNVAIAGNFKNIETINIDASATGAAAVAVDASKFAGATVINQIALAGAVTNLAAGTTAAFQGISAGGLSVAAAGSSASVSFNGVNEVVTLGVSGSTLSTVNVSGTRVDGVDAGTGVSALALTVTAGKDVQTVVVNSAGSTVLTVNEAAASTKAVATVDASGSAGAITFAADAATTTIKTGAGADSVTVTTTTAAATDTTAAVNATVSTGAGNDTVTIAATTGDGQISVDTGAGNDTVVLNSRGTAKLAISLGDGADVFTTGPGMAIAAGDSIDAGAGVDTLTLSLVGASNIGAFSNFDVFDAVGLASAGAKALDVDILATKNTVSEFIASGDVGTGAALVNVGAGVGVRATADMAGSSLSIGQKAGGALTVTVDADEATTADDAPDTATAAFNATNATSLKAVFDTAYLATRATETTAGDNVTTLNLTGGAATSLEIVSGGTLSNNVLNYTDSATGGKLAAITISGANALTLTTTTAAKLATIDASASTGGLTVSTDAVINGGVIKLGSGVDTIVVGAGSTAAGPESIQGFEKTGAIAISTKATDATAAGAAIADADTLVFAGAKVAADGSDTHSAISHGVMTFTGAGPSTLDEAISFANTGASIVGDAVVFEYLGNTYAFVQGGATDTVVKLVGITGVTTLAETGGATLNDHFILV
jgi:hypothetical protein